METVNIKLFIFELKANALKCKTIVVAGFPFICNFVVVCFTS